ncbi:hypothetical protein U2I54_06720 [Bacillus pseudomycoides]|uniref:Uncharacterized protein n=1 Tax=Bacillus bingmayongensis TaxID=1150157 RepID=A0ABU5JTM9_9BACI|nr:hypothetical protein [Bacillus pseudomycoides]
MNSTITLPSAKVIKQAEINMLFARLIALQTIKEFGLMKVTRNKKR